MEAGSNQAQIVPPKMVPERYMPSSTVSPDTGLASTDHPASDATNGTRDINFCISARGNGLKLSLRGKIAHAAPCGQKARSSTHPFSSPHKTGD
jgi:hypothetical protein